MATAVYCIARSESQAIRIAERLRASGFRADDISLLYPDPQGSRDLALDNSTKAPEGATVGAGIPEYEAQQYEGKLSQGNILISVHADDSDEASRIREVMSEEKADDISTGTEASVPHRSNRSTR